LNTLNELIASRQNSPTQVLEKKELKKLERSYAKASKRLLFLDYDGTLRPFTINPNEAAPNQELLEVLKKLSEDEENRVVIISGRDRNILEKWLGDTGAELIAEHGVWLKRKGEGWERNQAAENEWKEDFRHLFEEFTDRTPGTLIEEKEYSLVWHYRQADPDFAVMRARELENILSYMTSNRNLFVMKGNKIIELKHSSVNKGVAAMQWLRDNDYDFILAAGDDRTDEDLFKVLPRKAWRIKIGAGMNTNADYTLKSANEMIELLRNFQFVKSLRSNSKKV
jgi:trehalose 6-phosphate synthase/phosphatase